MLELRHTTKTYRKESRTIRAVDNVSCVIRPGDFLVVHGPSGSGKSTLLLMLGGMLPPDEGKVLFENEDLYGWSHARRNRYRMKVIGFVFQRFFLLPYLTVFDNIRLGFVLRGRTHNIGPAIKRLAERFQIEDRLKHRPGELSVGEQQRTALARALAADPVIILADEPTGNLDLQNGKLITSCLREESHRGRAVVMVTHNEALLDAGTRRLLLARRQA